MTNGVGQWTHEGPPLDYAMFNFMLDRALDRDRRGDHEVLMGRFHSHEERYLLSVESYGNFDALVERELTSRLERVYGSE